MKQFTLAAILAVAVMSVGCQSYEATARDAIGGANGFLTAAQNTHLVECQANPTKNVCKAINDGIAAQHAAAVSLSVYCAGVPAAGQQSYANGGPCVPVKSALSALQSVVANLNSIINTIKAFMGTSAKVEPWLKELRQMNAYLQEQN